MERKKAEVAEDVVEAVEETAEAPKRGKSKEREEFEKIIEAYKARNPEKYELKKDELAKKLANIK